MTNSTTYWTQEKGMSEVALRILHSSPAGRVALGNSPNLNISGFSPNINISKTSQTPTPQILTGSLLESKGMSKT